MGIIDALRKRVRAKSSIRKSEEQSNNNGFLGDLSKLNDSIQNDVSSNKPSVQKNSCDSDDSIVFLSNIEQSKSGWECMDCGTTNAYVTNCCVVCGFLQR